MATTHNGMGVLIWKQRSRRRPKAPDLCRPNRYNFVWEFGGLYSHDMHPTSGGVVALKTGRREVLGSNPGAACGPRHSEFSEVF